MTKLESKVVELGKPASVVFDFLSDFSNFQTLMPPQVIDWSADIEGVSFTIKGMATLGLKYESKTPHTEIVMVSKGKSPFAFRIITRLTDAGAHSKAQLFLEADLNPFLKMMAEKPLTNFLNLLADKLAELFPVSKG